MALPPLKSPELIGRNCTEETISKHMDQHCSMVEKARSCVEARLSRGQQRQRKRRLRQRKDQALHHEATQLSKQRGNQGEFMETSTSVTFTKKRHSQGLRAVKSMIDCRLDAQK